MSGPVVRLLRIDAAMQATLDESPAARAGVAHDPDAGTVWRCHYVRRHEHASSNNDVSGA